MSFTSTPCLSPRFVFDPYNPHAAKRMLSPSPSVASDVSAYGGSLGGASSVVAPPPPFAHPALERCVAFVPFASDAVSAAPVTTGIPKERMVRLFLGQLPYRITESLLQRVVFDVTGFYIFGVERIVKWSKGRQPTGCVHAYCDADAAQAVIEVMNGRVLFDDFGFWLAQNAYEVTLLQQYCASLDEHRAHRPSDRPCQTVTVEAARSTYAPRGKHSRAVAGGARW